MHFLVGSFGFLEGPDEACNFVKVFSVGTGGIKCASGVFIGFPEPSLVGRAWEFESMCSAVVEQGR